MLTLHGLGLYKISVTWAFKSWTSSQDNKAHIRKPFTRPQEAEHFLTQSIRKKTSSHRFCYFFSKLKFWSLLIGFIFSP